MYYKIADFNYVVSLPKESYEIHIGDAFRRCFNEDLMLQKLNNKSLIMRHYFHINIYMQFSLLLNFHQQRIVIVIRSRVNFHNQFKLIQL